MSTDDTMRSRVPGSRWKLWLLLSANRWFVAGLLLAAVFVALTVILAVDPVPLDRTVETSDPVETLFQAMLTAIVTGVTLVVTINQVVLSQELGPAGDQHERMQGSLAFRSDVAEQLEEAVSPPEPSAFLQAMIDATGDRARELRGAAADAPDSDVRDDVETYADELIENADSAAAKLDGAQFGTFDVLQAALGFNYSLKLFEGQRLRALHGGSAPEGDQVLGEDATEALDRVIVLLEQFGPAREHVKTLYFQWSLVDLSRAMLYTSIPALVVTIAAILTLNDGGTVGGSTLGTANHTWVVLGAVTISLAPFAILLSFVLRIATVAKRTLAIGPFVLRDRSRSGHDDGS